MNYVDFDNYVRQRKIEPSVRYFSSSGVIFLTVIDGGITFSSEISEYQQAELDLFNSYLKPLCNKDSPSQAVLPFASKVLSDGKKLYRRKHGVKKMIDGAGSIEFVIPYAQCKIDKIEIVGCLVGDIASLRIMYGQTMLNRFGFDVVLPNYFYEDKSDYDADLQSGLTVAIDIETSDGSSRMFGVNFNLHEVKA